MKYLLQASWLLNDLNLISELSHQTDQIYAISCCPWRRSDLAGIPKVKVINPFKSNLLGELNVDHLKKNILWIDQWPSLLSPRFDELRYWLLSSFETAYLSQSYSLKKETSLLDQFLFDDPWQILWKEKLFPYLLLKKTEILPLQAGLEELLIEGFETLKEGRRWPKKRYQVLFVADSFESSSYYYALSHRHHWVIQAHPTESHRLLSGLHWLIGQPKHNLISSSHENQDRGNPHQKGSLPGSTRHWHSSLKKWSQSLGSFLWWYGWRKKT